ncbi:hypothetical protein HDE68_000873 [Pedobacter cryoconitis]|uniref:Uncharacterized protein n=1 Tax=Pedobacter cryoconitis TaxID=188932 RepID=A0A7W9DXJ3_9SPHI|nr:hypothetical protein [Pedobacter cryoconitis]MBB5634988.1 hypothetical protein [Pedobacter cryoconitis]
MKTYNYILFFLAFSTCFTVSCKKETEVDLNLPIFEKLDGNYNIISAVSDRPYDINMDGYSSTDMLKEIPNLERSDINIVVNKQNRLFRLSWIEQYENSELSLNNARYSYNKQGVFNEFDTDKNLNSISLKQNLNQDIRFNAPNSINCEESGVIKIEIKKNIITSTGKQSILITASYKKDKNYKTSYK